MFYGTSRDDYGVSSDKNMQETPLYQAVKAGLLDLERGIEYRAGSTRAAAAPESGLTGDNNDLSSLFQDTDLSAESMPMFEQTSRTVEIPFGAAESLLMKPITRIADAVRLLRHVEHPRAEEVRALLVMSGKELFRNLQELSIISPLANDPIDEA
jgi:hypothetical protein